MPHKPSTADRQFVHQARAFISHHWSRPPAAGCDLSGRPLGVNPAEAARWHQALAEQGWLVPRWPVYHGGTGWSALRQALWAREAALADTPPPDRPGTEVVGPLLCRYGSAAQQAEHLPPIRAAAARWAVDEAADGGTLEGGGVTLRADPVAGGYRLAGETRVSAWGDSIWLLCAARTGESSLEPPLTLLMVAPGQPGVGMEALRGLDGQVDGARVRFDGVMVPASARLGDEHQGRRLLAALPTLPGAGSLLGSRCQRHLARLDDLASTLPDRAGRVADDSDYQRKRAELAVDLTALEGLERRVLTAERTGTRPAPLAAMLALRQAAAARRLGELYGEVLGYHGLPFPDPLSIHNEGPIGHHYALAAVTAALRSHGFFSGGAMEMHKNIIARAALGL